MIIPESELADLILRVARRLRRANALELEESPLNPHQARALRVVARLAPVRPSVVAERLHVAARSATDVVEFLVAGGWVERTPDPADRRARLLTLTASGQGLLCVVDAARARAAEMTLGGLTVEERQSVADALTRATGGGDAFPPPPKSG